MRTTTATSTVMKEIRHVPERLKSSTLPLHSDFEAIVGIGNDYRRSADNTNTQMRRYWAAAAYRSSPQLPHEDNRIIEVEMSRMRKDSIMADRWPMSGRGSRDRNDLRFARV